MRYTKITPFLLLFCCALALTSSACIPKKKNATPEREEHALTRADPGYVAYLEKLSLLQNSAEFSRIVSGSHLNWRAPSMPPNPEALLHNADVWISINPQSLLVPSQQSALHFLEKDPAWRIFSSLGARGLYLSPMGGGAALWALNTSNDAFGEDVIQYKFSEQTGTDLEYRALLATANKNRAILGMSTVPAATGLGPDFFLAGRLYRDFPGAYAMLEVDKADWPALPAVENEWDGKALTPAQVNIIHGKGLIPKLLSQDIHSQAPCGWAATGEIRGVDGVLHRWIYRFYGAVNRPVLNWEDPSGAALRILSGSIIQQVGLQGAALVGLPLDALMGLELEGTAVVGTALEPGISASIHLGRAAQRYGGWSWLDAEIPLTQTKALLEQGADFIRDSALSPAAEHALLTGDARLLHFMLDELVRLRIETKSLVHVSSSEEGISYRLPHLLDLEKRSHVSKSSTGTAGTTASPDASTARELRISVLAAVAQIAAPLEGEAQIFQDKRLYTSSAGVAALALGMRNASQQSITAVSPELAKGHFLLNFFKAMQPGIFMLSGQDIAGTLALDWQSMVDTVDSWNPRLASRGVYALDKSSNAMLVSQQGIARANTIYPTADVQIHDATSFIRRMAVVLKVRSALGIARGTLLGRIPTHNTGMLAFAIALPNPEHGIAITLCNFARTVAQETLSLENIPNLSLHTANAYVVAGNAQITALQKQLQVQLAPWEACTVLLGSSAAKPEPPAEQAVAQ